MSFELYAAETAVSQEYTNSRYNEHMEVPKILGAWESCFKCTVFEEKRARMERKESEEQGGERPLGD